MTKNKALKISLLLAALLAAPVSSAQAAGSKVWTGVDFGPKSYYTYVGGVTGLTGQNILNQDGWLLRASAGYGQYNYDTVAVAGGNVDGKVKDGDLMLGYGHEITNGRITGYIGAETQDQNLSPNDVNDAVRGAAAGLKAQAELELKPVDKVSANVVGSYSTAFRTYWTHGDVGYDLGYVTVGPEVGFIGNSAYNQSRFGGALSNIKLCDFAKAKVYAGYADTQGLGASGAYGGLGLSANF